ncbi:MAG: hypothetical protein HY902_13375 [Deltaproteobacteria bacterium]|nr:hypothetical protein [Deltaproteobacteria bacterium]
MSISLPVAVRAACTRALVPAGALVVAALSACSAPQVVEPQGADLPVTKVVLYQNGVGYFERHGTVRGRDVELRVRPDQINDVLKSLTVLDLSGSVAASVSLPVERSGDELAAQLPAQVRNVSGVQGLLMALRGAQVQVEGSAGSFSGKVVGVERGDAQADGKTEQVAMLTLLSSGETLQSVPLSGINKVVIGDRALALGVEQSLDLARRDGSWKPVAVQIRLADDGSHDLLVSYIHEVPVWRPAYRAWVEQGKGVTLQGWAIVDNVSGETWKDVDLTLVVGSPLSFRYDLHTPHKVPRPDLSNRLPQAAEAPPEAEAGYVAPAEEAPAPPPPPSPAYRESAKGGGRPASAPYKKAKADRAPAPAAADEGAMARDSSYERARAQQEAARRDAAMQQAQALVTGREVGALYTYQAQRPVTVPDRSAALINIVSRKIDGQDVFLFREPQSGQSPYRAVLLRNGKQSALEAGPITLYVDGTFAGEGFIARLGKDEVTFVPYAREAGLALNLDYASKTDELRLVRIVDSRITLQGKQRHTRTVRLQSNRDEASVAYVRLPRIRGTQIIAPPKDLVQTGDDVYLPVPVGPKAKAEVTFVEETPISVVEAGLTAPVIAALKFYLENAKPQDAIAGPIRDVLATQEEIAKLQIDLQNLAQQRDTLDQEQRRIQGNLDSLPPGAVAADLRKKLVAQLEDASRRAAEVAKRMVEDQVKLAALGEKLRELLRHIDLRAADASAAAPGTGVGAA